MIDVTLLGSSATMPIPGRALSSAFLKETGHSVLFDCGEGTQTAARFAGVGLMTVDIIALTHYHGDHIFGLPGLLQTMDLSGRTAPLFIFGPKGIETALSPILTLAGTTAFPVVLKECFSSVRLNDILPCWRSDAVLTPVPTKHRVNSCGYLFSLPRAGKFLPDKAKSIGVPVSLWGRLQHGESVEYEGRTILPSDVLGAPRQGLSVLFSGDTAPCESLSSYAHGIDLLIHDATYAEDEQEDNAREYGHTTFSQAAQLAKNADVKKLWLTHFSQMITDPYASLPHATDIFPAAEIGFDGKKTTLVFDENRS